MVKIAQRLSGIEPFRVVEVLKRAREPQGRDVVHMEAGEPDFATAQPIVEAERRNFLLPELRRLGFVIPNTPAGAFYLYADASRFTNDSRQFCLDLLEQHGVALTPGADFGSYRANEHIRFSFATGMPQLEKAVERLEKVLAVGG